MIIPKIFGMTCDRFWDKVLRTLVGIVLIVGVVGSCMAMLYEHVILQKCEWDGTRARLDYYDTEIYGFMDLCPRCVSLFDKMKCERNE